MSILCGSPVFRPQPRLIRDDEVLLRLVRGYLRGDLTHDDIDLAPHTELALEIDSRFHGKRDPGHEFPNVMRFEVIQVWTGAVQVELDRVTGTVKERISESTILDDSTRCSVQIRARDRRPSC